MNSEKFIEDMKLGIKNNPVTSKILKEMVDDGLSEDEALDIMIDAWLYNVKNGDYK